MTDAARIYDQHLAAIQAEQSASRIRDLEILDKLIAIESSLERLKQLREKLGRA